MTDTKVTIYTDGACSGNPGPGGWGAILMWNGNEKELSGFEVETTNNRMEMMAVIESLKALKKSCSVTICTDSKYVMQGATEWIHNWKKKNWKKADKKEVVNKDLWLLLDKEQQKHKIEWVWIKGHSGDEYNERADELAVAESMRAKDYVL